MTDSKALAAERWFGYGRWDAPYWFIGKEPGGSDDPEQYASWTRLGGSELIDCRDHDLDCPSGRGPGIGMWHGGEPRLQSTWRPLIAMLLAYEGSTTYDVSAVREYQDDRWGRTDGDTAVLELSAVAAPSTSYADDLRQRHLPARTETLRKRIREHAPKFVVFYGAGIDPVHGRPYLEYWSDIAQRSLTLDEPVIVDGTVFVAEPHPTAHGTTNAHWVELGHRLRSMHDSL